VHFFRLLAVCCMARCAKCTILLVTLPNIHRFKKKFTHTLSNKPFLIYLLTTPPHLKYVATLPYNLSLMACFADINVSQGGVYSNICKVRCKLTKESFSEKKYVNRLRFDRIMVMSLWSRFLAHPVDISAKGITSISCRARRNRVVDRAWRSLW